MKRNGSNWAVRIGWLGYTLFNGVTDVFGRKWKYAAFPNGSGSVAYFAELREMGTWVRQVEQVRHWQRETLPIHKEVL